MKFRNITIGVVVGGVIFAGGVAAVVWQKGLSIRETVELGAGVIAYPPSEASAEGGSMRSAKHRCNFNRRGAPAADLV